MTDFGRRSGAGDMLAADYDPIINALIVLAAAHKTQHQLGGDDVLSLAGLTPGLHKATHKLGGTDPIDCTGLTGAGGLGLLVDGVAGRVLRAIHLTIQDGTDANTLKATVGSKWNGDVIAVQDNIAKNATTGHYSLSSGGSLLTIAKAALSGDVKFAMCVRDHNSTAADFFTSAEQSGSNIRLMFQDLNNGQSLDFTGPVNTGALHLIILYITDA